MTERDDILRRRQELKARFGAVYDQVAAILARHDPEKLASGDYSDEYEVEADTILPRLASARDASDVRRIVYEEFVRWFGTERDAASFDEIAREIWVAWTAQSSAT
jgi:hypothetical protein